MAGYAILGCIGIMELLSDVFKGRTSPSGGRTAGYAILGWIGIRELLGDVFKVGKLRNCKGLLSYIIFFVACRIFVHARCTGARVSKLQHSKIILFPFPVGPPYPGHPQLLRTLALLYPWRASSKSENHKKSTADVKKYTIPLISLSIITISNHSNTQGLGKKRCLVKINIS